MLISPYDPEKHLWIVDDDQHIINIFTNDGKLVRTMGERGVPGRGPNNFNRPTDIAWLPDGTFFVADGYAGTRVAKFDRNGKFLQDWGQPPKDPAKPGPYEFWSVHSIGISRDRRLFVADREHHRMQVFDENGKFLEMWPTGHDSAVLAHIVTEDDFIWVADWTTDRLVKYDLNGRYILDIGGHGPQPGQFDGVHQISVDARTGTSTSPRWPTTARRSSGPKPTPTRRRSSGRWSAGARARAADTVGWPRGRVLPPSLPRGESPLAMDPDLVTQRLLSGLVFLGGALVVGSVRCPPGSSAGSVAGPACPAASWRSPKCSRRWRSSTPGRSTSTPPAWSPRPKWSRRTRTSPTTRGSRATGPARSGRRCDSLPPRARPRRCCGSTKRHSMACGRRQRSTCAT